MKEHRLNIIIQQANTKTFNIQSWPSTKFKKIQKRILSSSTILLTPELLSELFVVVKGPVDMFPFIVKYSDVFKLDHLNVSR